ncbi:class I SAM-dependent methyltransferase [Archangium violaceum]|uniref:SAM-dependent methyltransferase n=1 Tax=Archangium violaceum TaxID=83451 RepID=UPI00193B1D82|nr:cyclopropane-fatty-acyl-phospholipid synthase family protein [Archangium violaceum]QRK06769.1 class I SAM-dependent methyltransferase [Archangium violaceum]
MDAVTSFRLNPKDPSISARYGAGKVPMATLIEDYIHQRLDIEGDFLAFIRERQKVVDYKPVAEHFKFLFTRFLPEVVIHSQEQDVRIAREHYDRGNDFFGWFLGPRMIYTSGFFTSPNQTLEEAQDQKMKLVAEKLQLKKGERYLDIGCGWGTLVATVAKDYGVDSTGVTIAQKGAAYATEQIARMGVSDRARILTVDYRDIPRGPYDKISCLEMAEHVGVKNFQGFMRQVHDMLTDDGLFYLQIAGLRAKQGLLGYHLEDLVWGLFMNKYIFPGADASMPLSFVVSNLESAGFEIHSVENVGIHYSLTISRWYDNWMANRAEVVKTYGEWWFRLWQMFLGWSVEIAAQGSSTCFQIVANKNLDKFNRMRWVGAKNLGERDL